LCKEGYRIASNFLKIEKVDWEALQKLYGNKFGDDRTFVQAYDDVIYVLKSPIMKTRKIPNPERKSIAAELRIPQMCIKTDSRESKPRILFNRFSTEKRLESLPSTKKTSSDIFSHPRFR